MESSFAIGSYSDPAMVGSNFPRNDKDRYFSEPWTVEALLRRLDPVGWIWEPACGRGDIAKVLIDHGHDVIASDIDSSEYDLGFTLDFLGEDHPRVSMSEFTDCPTIITNPPYNLAVEFVEKALSFPKVQVVAMLLRSAWNEAKGRVGLFNKPPFAFEVVLTSRPRWDDWWNGKPPKAAPRHGYSWFVWDKNWIGPNSQFWEGKKA